MKSKNKVKIQVCMGSSCFARGNDKNLQFIESFIEKHKLDAEIDLIGSRCEKKCAEGPNILINDKMYKAVNLEILEKIILEAFLVKK